MLCYITDQMVKETLNQTISECVTVSFCSLRKNSEAEGNLFLGGAMNKAFPETQNALGHVTDVFPFTVMGCPFLMAHKSPSQKRSSTFWFSLGT